MLVLCGAGVGGGSHVYANTLYVPPRKFFDAPEWAGITDWADELAPYIDQASRMLGVVRYPYLPTDVDRYMKDVAIEMGRGETFNKTPVGVYFGRPGVEAEDPYFGGAGPRRTGCISCGNCNNGCGHNAKNKLTTNYLYLAEKLGAEVHELHEVYELAPLDGGGFEVRTRHPGWAQRAAHLHHHTYTAGQVIVAAHAYGSAKLLHHMQHTGRLTGLSSQLGQRARTNSEQLLAVTRTHGEWERDPEKIRLTPGSVSITSGVWPDPVTSIEPVYWGVGSDLFAYPGERAPRRRAEAPDGVVGQGAGRAPGPGPGFRRRTPLVRADRHHAVLADDGHLDRAVLGRRPAAEPARRRRGARGAHPGRREVRRPAGREDGQPRRRAALRDHQPRRLGALRRRDPDR